MRCPNCNGKIGTFELAPNCKHCGINIFYSQQEELLSRDAKKCELEYATFHILAAKFKNAFIGGPLQILRIVAMLCAIGGIFIPFASLTVQLPLFTSEINFGAFGVYQAISDGIITAVIGLKDYLPDLFGNIVALAVLFVLIFLFGFGIFVTLVLSFINIQKSTRIGGVFSLIGTVLCFVAQGVSVMLTNSAQGTFVKAESGVGALVCGFVLLFMLVLDLVIIKKNIQPTVKEVDLQRVEIRKKIKAGEISIDDLPIPILESDEEREKRLQAEEQSLSLAEKAKGGEGNG